jgi:uncharacterized protein (TIGR00297 family)
LLAGAVLAIAVAAGAWRLRALSTGGAMAAAALGTLAVMAGWSWAILLVVYFVTATLLSRYRARDKDARTNGIIAKDGARDALQVLANGGAFGVSALAHIVWGHAAWQLVAGAALAASAADTWATELGVLAGRPPRSIIGWRPVPVGTSGGVTLQGLIGALAGAATIALATRLVRWPLAAGIAALVGGVAGSLLDSILGATVQSRRWCGSCDAGTEQRVHRCGRPTHAVGGAGWIDNDGVNAISTVGGALLGASIGMAFDA